MLTMEATSILRKADPRFRFRDNGPRPLEIAVRFNEECVGYLEHDEMADRQPVIECIGHYGRPWTDERKAEGYHPYYREAWQIAFRNIIGQVPQQVAERIQKILAKRGWHLGR